ncbi:MAG: DUF4974 domain-containing protein [Chitinophagaceae bacterium]|nr:DUF4974 domain-containing protein [Chitinophagaceae bacterium]
MSSNPLRLKYLFEKYISNSCSSPELREFWQLVAHLSDNDFLSEDIKNLWDIKPVNSPPQQVDWDAVYGRLVLKMEEKNLHATHPINRTGRSFARLAAAAAILFCVIVSAWWLGSHFLKEQPVAKSAVAPIHQTLILPDGSMVTLNTGSKLSYPTVFNGSTRDVYLIGEAYFDIKHEDSKPFIVHSGTYVTVVLGTAFNIKAYPFEDSMSITVAKGKVKVENTYDKKSLGILLPGDQLVISKAAVSGNIKKADVQKVLQWKKEELVFDNITFDEAAVILSNRYGIEMLFDNDRLRNCRFTCRFSSENTVDEILDIVCTLTNAEWNRENKSVILLKGAGCSQ